MSISLLNSQSKFLRDPWHEQGLRDPRTMRANVAPFPEHPQPRRLVNAFAYNLKQCRDAGHANC